MSLRMLLLAGAAAAAAPLPLHAHVQAQPQAEAQAETPAQPAVRTRADDAPPDAAAGVETYTPDFFAAFAPVTALDMIQRVPGFLLRDAGSARGFGANAGNVLIDGERPSTKSETLSTVLARIPAARVLRLEVIGRAGGAVDAQGQGQVLNVVTTRDGRVSGTYALVAQAGTGGGVEPGAQASVAFAHRGIAYAASVEYARAPSRTRGAERLEDTDGDTLERRRLAGRVASDTLTVSGTLDGQRDGLTFGANLSLIRETGENRRDTAIFDADGRLLGEETLRERSPARRQGYEAGADLEFGWSEEVGGKLVALYNRFDTRRSGRVRAQGPGLQPFARRTRSEEIAREAILRLQNDWRMAPERSLRFGAELAFNALDARFSSEDGLQQPLPATDVAVDELRLEPFVSFAWPVAERWKGEIGLIAEQSRLRVGGERRDSRTFRYWKPSALATWTIDDASSLEFRLVRDVAQLDFTDFATSVDLSTDGRVDAGNAQLRPQRTSTLSAVYRRTFLERGSAQLLGAYARVSDTQDLVPVVVRDDAGNPVSRFDGPGNVGDSRQWDVELELLLPIDALLGAREVGKITLTYSDHVHDGRVEDPVTGRDRPISGRWRRHFSLDLRHDLPGGAFAWGARTAWGADFPRYFIDEYQRFSNRPELTLYAEYGGFRAGKLAVTLGNVGGVEQDRVRERYAVDRGDARFDRRLVRTLRTDPGVEVRFSGTF